MTSVMDKSKTFEELLVWQKAHEFVLLVYKITDAFPKTEVNGLTSQFRRAAVSIAANIAEGYKKKDFKNKIHYLNIAHSSLEECRYYYILSRDLQYQNEPHLLSLIDETGKLLNAYSSAIVKNNTIS
jgi:four helix bundle protein